MIGHQFSPFAAQALPCWHCCRFDGLVYDGSAALCFLTLGARVRSLPAWGCASFEREPGADDEPGPPPIMSPASARVRAAARPVRRRTRCRNLRAVDRAPPAAHQRAHVARRHSARPEPAPVHARAIAPSLTADRRAASARPVGFSRSCCGCSRGVTIIAIRQMMAPLRGMRAMARRRTRSPQDARSIIG